MITLIGKEVQQAEDTLNKSLPLFRFAWAEEGQWLEMCTKRPSLTSQVKMVVGTEGANGRLDVTEAILPSTVLSKRICVWMGLNLDVKLKQDSHQFAKAICGERQARSSTQAKQTIQTNHCFEAPPLRFDSQGLGTYLGKVHSFPIRVLV